MTSWYVTVASDAARSLGVRRTLLYCRRRTKEDIKDVYDDAAVKGSNGPRACGTSQRVTQSVSDGA